MKMALVGYTGFVGSNLLMSHSFDYCFNTRNISEAVGIKPDLLVYAGIKSEKFIANQFPEEDFNGIMEAYHNMIRIKPKKLVLISTIDVYPIPQMVYEDTEITANPNEPYGFHRYQLEQLVRKEWPDSLIIRLPALFGENIKKNFIYDFIYKIPALLTGKKYEEISIISPEIKNYYQLQQNGYYRYIYTSSCNHDKVIDLFQNAQFNAMYFTDSRSQFQFYHLENLWFHIKLALKEDLKLLNLATEPLEISELYHFLTGNTFYNHLSKEPVYYDMRTSYGNILGLAEPYIVNKKEVLEQIRKFILNYHGQVVL